MEDMMYRVLRDKRHVPAALGGTRGEERQVMTRRRCGSSCQTRSGRKEEERPQKGAKSEEMGILFVFIALVFIEYVMSISINC